MSKEYLWKCSACLVREIQVKRALRCLVTQVRMAKISFKWVYTHTHYIYEGMPLAVIMLPSRDIRLHNKQSGVRHGQAFRTVEQRSQGVSENHIHHCHCFTCLPEAEGGSLLLQTLQYFRHNQAGSDLKWPSLGISSHATWRYYVSCQGGKAIKSCPAITAMNHNGQNSKSPKRCNGGIYIVRVANSCVIGLKALSARGSPRLVR